VHENERFTQHLNKHYNLHQVDSLEQQIS